MIQSPSNRLIVLPKSKFTSAVSNILKESSLQNGATVDPTDIVTIQGEVISIPKFISPTREYRGFSTKDIRVGDIAIFSYRVIYDHKMELNENGEVVAKHRNSVTVGGKEYFLCNIRDLFGVIRDGRIIMVNGYVMVTEHEESQIVLPNYLKKIRGTVASDVIEVGSSLTHQSNMFHVKKGDEVFYSKNKAQHYQINGKKFVILHMNHILGKREVLAEE
jgi:co-chaperonin GroES (HSP10)